MKEDDFKKLRTEVLRKAGLVNMSLKKKISYDEALKIHDITNDKFNLMGWQYNQNLNLIERIEYVTFDDLKVKFPEPQEETKDISIVAGGSIPMFSDDDVNHLQDFISNYKIIMQMIAMFKDNKQIDADNKSITIELPYEDDKSFKASYRVNKTINKQFKEFCKQHKEFTAKDLLSMALKEYMDKYKQINLIYN